MIFEDGSREPLHGHNYRVQMEGSAEDLKGDMVFDFLDIKPIVRKVCDGLDHKLIIPQRHPNLIICDEERNYRFETPDGDYFSVPKNDVLLLPILNSSVELIAEYLATQIKEQTWKQFQYRFKTLQVEVEESPGQSAVYITKEEL